MASKSLTFDLFGKDVTASKTMRGVGTSATGMGSKFKAAGIAIAAGLVVVGAAVVKFGIDSVKAYSEAAEQQNKLAFAFKQFPQLADTNQKALQKLNSAIQAKTRFDDDDLAGAQATLAQYKLTGAQIIQLTPLLADYAQKTGKDVVTAAGDLGKAMLGQGRGLKAIGVNFKDTGSAAGNFAELVSVLGEKVGGFAEQAGGTAAGKLEIFQHKISDIQESIGEKLMPVLSDVVDYGTAHFLPFLESLSKSNDIQDFAGAIDKLRSGDPKYTGGMFDGDAWHNASVQMTIFFTGVENYNAKYGNGPFDWLSWQHGFDQILVGFDSFRASWAIGVLNWTQGTIAQFGNGWQQLMGKFGNGWQQILAGADSFRSSFVNKIGQVVTVVASLGDILPRALGDMGARFYNVGAQIVQGIISGITSWAGRAAASVAKMASDLLHTAERVLGINSPSKVFRDRVGVGIGEGVVVGIDSMRPKVAASVSSLVAVPAVGRFSSAGTGVLSGSSEGFGGGMTNNFYMTEITDQEGTALAVLRRLNRKGAV